MSNTEMCGNAREPPRVSAIVPTIGRPRSLHELLESIANQEFVGVEVFVADGSAEQATKEVTSDPSWHQRGLSIMHLPVSPPNAVRQRQLAIDHSSAPYLLLLDDDVVVEPHCIQRMVACLDARPDVVAVTAMISNQRWPRPTRLWATYLRHVLGIKGDAWQGRVVGPVLRYGYDPAPSVASRMEWLGTGNSMIRREAYVACGGFSHFFLHRCTINEDVDLGLKLSARGTILLDPACKVVHNHAPSGRVSPRVASEDDAYNRFMILRYTRGTAYASAAALMMLYWAFESISDFVSIFRGRGLALASQRLYGRTVGLAKAMARIGP